MKLKHGSEEEITELDQDGSTVSQSWGVHDGQYMPKQYKRFTQRVKVKDDKDVLSEFLKFTDFLANNDKLFKEFNWRYEGAEFDPTFKIEKRPNAERDGYYYVLKCWTERT